MAIHGKNNILHSFGSVVEKIETLKEIFLTNLVMISEIPSPTFAEHKRTEFIASRFAESGLESCSTDELSNVVGMIPGQTGKTNILVVAHLDTLFSLKTDHTITIRSGQASGPGIGDNGVGLAALVTLPQILKVLDVQLDANVILLGASRSLGEGNLEGLRFFLSNHSLDGPISSGVCVEGVKLGRLSYASIGMLRGEISYRLPESYDWTRFNAAGAIVDMHEIIGRILEIPLPGKPKTSIVFGSIEGGHSFHQQPTKATLRFEVSSESEEMVRTLAEKISFLATETSSRTGAMITFKELARRKPGGIPFAHPLNTKTRQILSSLGVTPHITPSTSELSAFIDEGIVAITIGLTDGENLNEPDESIQLKPLMKGLAQLVGILVTIDGGVET